MSFINAVGSVPEIAQCLKSGLQALDSKDKDKVKVKLTKDLKGSVNIDTCLKKVYPTENRWDYVFGYKNCVYYVEVHPGSTGEVKKIVAKLKWLKQWRESSAASLENLKEWSTYHWVSSGRTDSAIGRNSRYRRILDQNGIQGPSSVLQADAVS